MILYVFVELVRALQNSSSALTATTTTTTTTITASTSITTALVFRFLLPQPRRPPQHVCGLYFHPFALRTLPGYLSTMRDNRSLFLLFMI